MYKFIFLLFIVSGMTIAQSSLFTNSQNKFQKNQSIGSVNEIPIDSIYFGFAPPGDSAIVFAPGFISLANRKERTPNYMPDYSEFYFTLQDQARLYSTKYQNGWGVPVQDNSFRTNVSDLSISEDGSQANFTSWDGTYNGGTNTDIWLSTRTEDGWQTPEKLPQPINSSAQEWGACVLQNKTVYVCKINISHSDIVKYVYNNGTYTQVNLPWINSTSFEWDPFIPEDESYIIFKSDRPGGYGYQDLYISYKKEDGSYTNPKNLGPKINTSSFEDCGNLTPDGKYFMFGRTTPDGSSADIYWVGAGFINSLRNTNFNPYLLNPLPDQTANVGEPYSFSIADSIFIDDDGNETLTYTAELSNGSELPAWLSFDSINKTLSGIPESTGTISIKISVTDPTGASASDIFVLQILEQGDKVFLMDGTLDGSAQLVSSNEGQNLYIDWDSKNGILYLATESAQTANDDVFILLSDAPGGTSPSPWGKAGIVKSYKVFVGNEVDNGWSGWFDGSEQVDASIGEVASGNMLECTIDLTAKLGAGVENVYIAVGVYGTNSGDVLLNQVPAGNGDENIDADEVYTTTLVSVNEKDSDLISKEFKLEQNFPNPFNPSTAIRYSVPAVDALSNAEVHVSLKVYDVLGNEVATLINKELSAGSHTIEFTADNLASGIYIYRIQAGEFIQSRKMILLK